MFRKSEITEQPMRRQSGTAVVDRTIQPGKKGRVKFEGSTWFASCAREITLPPGESVQVWGRKGITLLVDPMPGHHPTSEPYADIQQFLVA